MAPSPSLGSPLVFARLLQTAREAGMDEDSLRELQRRNAWPERDSILAQIMRTLRIDGFPIRVARRTSVADIGALGTAARAAPDLRGAFERLSHLQHALTGAAAVAMREDVANGTVVLEHPRGEDNDLGSRCRREMAVAIGLQFAREISGDWIRPRRACLAHAAPGDPSEHEAFFGCEVRFAAGYDGLELERETLATPLPAADPGLSYFLLDQLRVAAGEPPSEAPSVEGAVRRAIRARLGRQTPTMAVVAREIGVSSRTLRRRLLERRTSYHEILDRVRLETADELLGDPSLKTAEVGFLVGFSDPSAFHRAYVRWTGRTPRRDKRRDS